VAETLARLLDDQERFDERRIALPVHVGGPSDSTRDATLRHGDLAYVRIRIVE